MAPTVLPRADKPIRAAIYARVSTSDQSSGAQLAELRAFCARRGWEITGEFIDEGISGSKRSRPSLDRLLAGAESKSFDAVVVYRYDRFARSLSHLVSALASFDSWGVQFVSVSEGVDTTTPNGRLVFGIFASIAEFERELIRERTRSGLRNAKARGVRCGRPPVTVNVSHIQSMKAAGLSERAIGRSVGISGHTVAKALRLVET
jgi:DNA invertase Pin-like site-specific DNA recombinase